MEASCIASAKSPAAEPRCSASKFLACLICKLTFAESNLTWIGDRFWIEPLNPALGPGRQLQGRYPRQGLPENFRSG